MSLVHHTHRDYMTYYRWTIVMCGTFVWLSAVYRDKWIDSVQGDALRTYRETYASAPVLLTEQLVSEERGVTCMACLVALSRRLPK